MKRFKHKKHPPPPHNGSHYEWKAQFPVPIPCPPIVWPIMASAAAATGPDVQGRSRRVIMLRRRENPLSGMENLERPLPYWRPRLPKPTGCAGWSSTTGDLGERSQGPNVKVQRRRWPLHIPAAPRCFYRRSSAHA